MDGHQHQHRPQHEILLYHYRCYRRHLGGFADYAKKLAVVSAFESGQWTVHHSGEQNTHIRRQENSQR